MARESLYSVLPKTPVDAVSGQSGAEAEGLPCSPEFLEDSAAKLKVCGHPVRLKLLCTIARQEDPCVSELWVCLKQPQPVISQHLAVLKEKGIVRSEVHGNRRVYSIIDPFVQRMIESLRDLGK